LKKGPERINPDGREVRELLKGSRENLLMLDYDGTLAPFRAERDKAVPYPGVREVIEDLMRKSSTRLVIVSGRAVSDLLPLLGLDPLPEIWGSHGWERRWPSGRYRLKEPSEKALEGLASAREWAVAEGLESLCEKKPASVAVHWRGLSEDSKEKIREIVSQAWGSIAKELVLELKEFDGGLELRVPGRNKGNAVDTILSESSRVYAAAYLGDDITDEDAFKAMANRGLSVLVRKDPRPTQAEIWIRPPEELLVFLQAWAAAVS
jgi:trehalose-phosphatase